MSIVFRNKSKSLHSFCWYRLLTSY